ncbi:hypothetical protein [Alteribacter populi]|uniref:hypothetical protein n=1 Tax=Alteribacter populi TaxID=2011011 RepID=UPI000BBAE26C|nr:hypothetical protein [Alteribacter populi]
MTMVIAVKNGDSVIMTADKRVTQTNISNGTPTSYSDDYKKIKVIDNRYIVSFAGRTFVAEQAFDFIDHNIERLSVNEPSVFFKDAFNYGKACFESRQLGIPATSTFFLGYIQSTTPILQGFSSDDDYNPINLDATIKARATSLEAENIVRGEAVAYINSELERRNNELASTIELSNIYFQAIRRVNDVMIGDTANTVVLSPRGIEEIEHP